MKKNFNGIRFLLLILLVFMLLISATQAALPIAAFSGTPRLGRGYVTVQFTDSSTGNPTSWAWDFNNDRIIDNTTQNPKYTYFGAGYLPSTGYPAYTVNLTVSNSDGSDSEVKQNYITVYGETTRIHIVKYDTDGTTVISERTVNYTWMEENLQVRGDGTTHYYLQGPIFINNQDPITQETLRWNPEENSNVLEKDYGAVKGTYVTDLLDLVGGMSNGDQLEVFASDRWDTRFSYRDVYNPPPRIGKMVLCWYKDGQYVPYYFEGMRIIWFADTSVNPDGVQAMGNWDWHEVANPNYWYYFTDLNGDHPTTTGISAKFAYELRIFTAPSSPVADFKINRTSEHQIFTTYTADAPLTVKFIDWSTNDPTTWAWDFNNDGITDSTLERPIHTFTTPGTYTVKLTVTNSAGSDTETKTDCIVVTGTPPTIDIDTTGGITNWPFVTGTNEDTTSVDLSVTTTAGSWQVSVKDALDDGKPSGTAGKMSEYTGSAYVTSGYEVLTNALQVKSGSGSYVTLSGSDQVVQTGSSSGTSNYDIWMKQEIAAGDPVITPNVYRIVVTFTGATN